MTLAILAFVLLGTAKQKGDENNIESQIKSNACDRAVQYGPTSTCAKLFDELDSKTTYADHPKIETRDGWSTRYLACAVTCVAVVWHVQKTK